VLAGVAASGSGCLTVEAELAEVEITQRGVVFTGVSPIGGGDTAMTKTYAQDHSALDLPPEFSTELKTLGVTLTATSGVVDLSFIHYLRVSMSAAGPEEAIDIAEYEPGPGASVGNQLSLTTRNPIDVLDAWQGDTATFTLEIAGTLPPHDWTGDVTVRFSGSASYSY
jgi:hypothetical protein